MSDLVNDSMLDASALGHLTSAVQLGFILGTLVFAVFTIADRFSPSEVFLVSAVLGSLFNLGVIWDGNTLMSILSFRFLTGFFLAGIYPVGMKIAADYYDQGLGKSLGFLVGALVIGTAFPHLLKDLTSAFPWRAVLVLVSCMAALGGLLMTLFVADGPHRKAGQKVDLSSFLSVFQNQKFRSSAFGYFGHMWELYTFWAFVPILLLTYQNNYTNVTFNIPLLSFIIIGALGFVWMGLWVFMYNKPEKHSKVNAAELEYIQQDDIADSKLEGYVPESTKKVSLLDCFKYKQTVNNYLHCY